MSYAAATIEEEQSEGSRGVIIIEEGKGGAVVAVAGTSQTTWDQGVVAGLLVELQRGRG